MTQDQVFGRRVREARRSRPDKMTQAELAQRVGRTESWMGQVERGIIDVDSRSMRRELANALGVPLASLEVPDGIDPLNADVPRSNITRLRLAISGHPAPSAVVDRGEDELFDLEQARSRTDLVWELEHGADYAQVDEILPDLITDLERASRTASEQDKPYINGLLARAYHAASASLARRNDPASAWVAADRSLFAGERSEQPLHAIAGSFRLAHSFMRLKELTQAEHVAAVAWDALRQRSTDPEASPEELSLYGAMGLTLAVIRARESDREGARSYIQEALAIADRVGEGRNDFNTEFGPANSQIHAVEVALTLGDYGEALAIAADTDTSSLSEERQARFHQYVARGHAWLDHPAEAVKALEAAKALAPEWTRTHPGTREIVAFIQLRNTRTVEGLSEFVEWLDVED
jgi:transcriptional regulator with XRE-family HTH domain